MAKEVERVSAKRLELSVAQSGLSRAGAWSGKDVAWVARILWASQ